MKTTLFIPVLNELEGVKVIMPRIHKEWVDEILIVDGDSTDGTREYLEEQGYTVIRQKEKGLIAAYWECIEASKGDVIIAFSPDNNSVPELIPAMVRKMGEGYDLVIASRYLAGARSYDDGTITAFGNWMFTRMINLLYGGRYSDALVMYRAFRKDLIKTLSLAKNQHPFLEIELVIRSLKHGLKLTEIPGDEPKRIGGISKMRVLYHGSAVLYVVLKELFVHRVGRTAVASSSTSKRFDASG